MHVVYYVRPGDNEELRFSLRSVEANVPDPEVTIIGDHPDWLDLSEAEFIQGNGLDPSTPEGKYGNALVNMTKAIYAFPGDFVVFNDDFIVLQSITEDLPLYSRHSLTNHHAQTPNTNLEYRYRKHMLASANVFLRKYMPDPLSYETHLPMPINGDRLKRTIEDYWEWWGREEPLMWRSVYGNMETLSGAHSVNRRDVIAHTPSMVDADADFISTSDRSFNGVMDLIQYRFPEPSRWEK